MNRESRIFVAGGTGMVGSAIIRKLVEKGYGHIISNYHRRHPFVADLSPVTFYQIDLTDQSATERFFESNRPEYVFLAAAKVGGIVANSTYKAEFIYENMAIALNVVHASYKYGVKKLLNLGSSCIYPRMSPQPMKEEHLLTGPLEPTNEPYAIAKIAAIKLCRYYNEQYSTNFISVMPTNLYGPNDNFNLETSHVLPALLRKFHLAKLLERGDLETIKEDFKKHPLGFGLDEKVDFSDYQSIVQVLYQLGIEQNPSRNDTESLHSASFDKERTMTSSPGKSPVTVKLWGTGQVYREFLHVDDLADACVFLMENIDARDLSENHPGRKDTSGKGKFVQSLPDYFVNVGSGMELTVKALSSLIKDIVGFKGEVLHDPTKPDGMPKKLLDVSRVNELGWKPRISLEEGIKRTYEWYLGKS